ncbi:MAG TPA: hypothetical protein DCP90_09570 [Clostridiales bacterium]|nr:MAG: hypothetical protein A2Y22_08385 [Clostridiales bacterium GWD2_32_59]HAN10837.1 hypothetical protein [Clostridiales bacterium]
MKTMTISKWVGAKARVVEDINSLRPETCNIHLESFGGMFSVGTHSTAERRIYNDLNPKLVALMTALSNNETREPVIRKMFELEYSEECFKKIKERVKKEFDTLSVTDKAAFVWYLALCSYNGMMKEFAGIRKGNEDVIFENSLIKKVEIAENLEGIEVYNKSALDILKEYKDMENCFILNDSPYFGELRTGGKLYANDMMTESEHRKMLEILVDSKAKVVVCGYDNALYNEILCGDKGWNKYILKTVPKSSKVSILGETKDYVDEIIWTNFEVK